MRNPASGRRTQRWDVCAAMFAMLFAGCATPRGTVMEHKSGSSDFGPWWANDVAPMVAPPAPGVPRARSGANDGFVDAVFGLYRNYLTKVDGPRCAHRPTCSHYAYLAVKEHGYVIGSFMTIDRLLRGSRSSVLRELETDKIEKGLRYYHDPVGNNDFFF